MKLPTSQEAIDSALARLRLAAAISDRACTPETLVSLTGPHPVRVTTAIAQELRLALDVGEFDELAVELRVLRLEGTTPTVDIELETGMQLDADHGWVSVASFPRVSSAPTIHLRNVRGLLRYLRWRVSALGGTTLAATFLIDGIARRWRRAHCEARRSPLASAPLSKNNVAEAGPFQVLSQHCPLGWKPSIWQPVFAGIHDLGWWRFSNDGAPTNIRILYPSAELAVLGADVQILEECGTFPVVLFAHGVCPGAGSHVRWTAPLMTLARCGYIVIIPEIRYPISGCPNSNYPTLWLQTMAALKQQLWYAYAWTLFNWKYAHLIDTGQVGIAGHSCGSIVAAELVADHPNTFRAFASVDGAFGGWASGRYIDDARAQQLLWNITLPKLFIMGGPFAAGSDEAGEAFNVRLPDGTVAPITMWSNVPERRHRLWFEPLAFHFDFVRAQDTCQGFQRGDCSRVWRLSSETLATFFSKYMPPTPLPITLGPAMIPPTLATVMNLNPTPGQMIYLTEHLSGTKWFVDNPTCTAFFHYETPEQDWGIKI